jgi:hypothetical protein
MPAKSKAQQNIFGMADAIQKGKMSPGKSPMAAKIAKSASPKSVHDFAATKTGDLPMHTVSNKLKKIRTKR